MSFREYAVRLLLLPLLLILALGRVTAQDQTVIRIAADTTTLQTGQYYDLAIRIENAPPFWALDLALEYDPTMLYVAGTRAGSPITAGDMFSSVSSIVVNNTFQDTQIRYTISKVGETAPAEGSGVIGTLRVFPMRAGTTRLIFPQVEAVALSSYDPNATDVTTQVIEVVPALLDLTISGADFEAPPEPSATPAPSETPTLAVALPTQNVPTDVPTLENIVFSTATPASLTTQDTPAAADNSGLIAAALGLIVLAGVGLGAIVVMQRRRR